jgi:hypothetical protein
LLFYIKECYDTEPDPNLTSLFHQFSAININAKGGQINLVLVYRPPISNAENLCELLNNVPSNTVVIGDFNLLGINWSTGTVNGHGRRLLNAVE